MPTEITRADVQRLIDAGAQVVDVLPKSEFDEEHITGSVSIPLKTIEKRAADELDRTRPVVVYCFDSAWDLSPRAAWRLEALGFTEVYDYVGGVSDWAAAGLPTEGTNRAKPRAGDLARRDVVTCTPDEPVGAVRARIERSNLDVAVVVNDERVVAGLLRLSRLDAASDGARVDAAMELGPSTFRPNVSAEEMAHYMTERDLPSAPITTSDGRLIGLLLREDAVAVA